METATKIGGKRGKKNHSRAKIQISKYLARAKEKRAEVVNEVGEHLEEHSTLDLENLEKKLPKDQTRLDLKNANVSESYQ